MSKISLAVPPATLRKAALVQPVMNLKAMYTAVVPKFPSDLLVNLRERRSLTNVPTESDWPGQAEEEGVGNYIDGPTTVNFGRRSDQEWTNAWKVIREC